MVEYLHNENRVPDYILKAIHFALKDRELNAVLTKMLAYNMSLIWELTGMMYATRLILNLIFDKRCKSIGNISMIAF